MKILFLDDSLDRLQAAEQKFRKDELVTTMTAAETIQRLQEQTFELVMLDHDLGQQAFVDSNRPDCGMEVVRWLVAHRPPIELIVVHSWNEPAAKEMVRRLRDAGYQAQHQPFYSS